MVGKASGVGIIKSSPSNMISCSLFFEDTRRNLDFGMRVPCAAGILTVFILFLRTLRLAVRLARATLMTVVFLTNLAVFFLGGMIFYILWRQQDISSSRIYTAATYLGQT